MVVKGPTSALSSFLRERGIRMPNRGRFDRAADRPLREIEGSTAVDTVDTESTLPVSQVEPSSPAQQTPVVEEDSDDGIVFNIRRKRIRESDSNNNTPVKFHADDYEPDEGESSKRVTRSAVKNNPTKKTLRNANGETVVIKNSSDSDDVPLSSNVSIQKKKKKQDDEADLPIIIKKASKQPSKMVHSTCQRCSHVFVYGGVADAVSLCPKCLQASTVSETTNPSAKKRKKNINNVHDLVMVKELNKKLLPLYDICIKTVCKYIDHIESFGESISESTRDKICLILSKHRKLDSATLPLMFHPDNMNLKLYDCANLDEDCLRTIPLSNQNLKCLKLFQCGQLTDAVLEMICKYCTQLEVLSLVGCFLIHDSHFKLISESFPKLSHLELEHSARLHTQTISSLFQLPNLKVLYLKGCTKLSGGILNPLSSCTSLTRIDFSNCTLLEDASFLELIPLVGPKLIEFRVGNCRLLSNVVVKMVFKFCPILEELDISALTITDEAFAEMNIPRNLKVLNLNYNHNLSETALSWIQELDVENLQLNGLKELTEDFLLRICKKGKLSIIDISWIPSVSDCVVDTLLLNNPDLKLIKYWGCMNITEFCQLSWEKRRADVVIEGSAFLRN